MPCCGGRFVPEDNFDNSPVVIENLGKASEVPPGTKKMFEVRGRKILVINDDGKLFAINGLCSHYNWPLDQGIYANGKIRCPLHGACFNVKNGDIEDLPGFDSLNSFQVEIIRNDIILTTTEKKLEKDRRQRKHHCTRHADAPIIVIGSGPASQSFIESVRFNGNNDAITLITNEEFPPYDRVLVSKNPVLKGDQIRLRNDDFYKENNITLLLNTTITEVNPLKREILSSTGTSFPFSKLIIATGTTPRKIEIPGNDLKNIFYLRTVGQGNDVAEKAEGKDVVCIGGSFIGLEIASALVSKAKSVTVLSRTNEPMPVFGDEVGASVRKHFETRGVKIITYAEPIRFSGSWEVEGVQLKDGRTIPADLVVIGIGVIPNTEFLNSSGIRLDKRGFIEVDNQFRTSAHLVYAIGDAVTAPLPLWGIDSINIQHFQMAQTHGDLLGYSITGRRHPRPVVPFFWSLFFFEFAINFSGCSDGYDSKIRRGDVDKLDYVQYFFKDHRVVAVMSAGSRPVAVQFLELFKRDRPITKSDVIKNVNDEWQSWIEQEELRN